MTNKAIFLDRDGVLVKPIIREGVVSTAWNLEEFQIYPNIRSALIPLVDAGYLIFVVTNQPDIARGNLSTNVLEEMNQKLIAEMGGAEIVKRVYVCRHDVQDKCECRKPKSGMLKQAAAEFDINLTQSYMVGDRHVDIEAGQSARCKSILIQTSYNVDVEADYAAQNLQDAQEWILESTV